MSLKLKIRQLANRILFPVRRYRLKNAIMVDLERTPEMENQAIAFYAKQFHKCGEQVIVHYQNLLQPTLAQLSYFESPGNWREIAEFSIETTNDEAPNAVHLGCNWRNKLTIPANFVNEQGYYRITVPSAASIPSFFILGDDKPASIAVLAPVSTWTAYNPWGGKSLYKNGNSKTQVDMVSAIRPNTALQTNTVQNIHAIEIEANIFNWMQANFGATLLPDYALEYADFSKFKTIVLSYHCEYASVSMMENLRKWVLQSGKSLLSLGANQFYWKVQWQQNYEILSCRKNFSSFDDGNAGGLFKHSSTPEDEVLNASFTDSGMGTYAPYKALNENHFLMENTKLETGDLFGARGFIPLGISGDECDKAGFFVKENSVLLAKGINPKKQGDFLNYPNSAANWNGEGGAELRFRELSNKHGILSTGSIQSGAGLGYDKPFTQIISNFLKRYAQ